MRRRLFPVMAGFSRRTLSQPVALRPFFNSSPNRIASAITLLAPTAPIDERDIAAVAVRALCDEGHAGAEYVLTGPQSLSQFEQVSTIGRVIGRTLSIQEISPDEAQRELSATMPAFIVKMLLDAWSAGVGLPAFVTSTVAEITGTPARTFLDWATDHAADFRTRPREDTGCGKTRFV
jgi:uncharacterized protein YbjT (DUF2867 family)